VKIGIYTIVPTQPRELSGYLVSLHIKEMGSIRVAVQAADVA